MSSTLRPNPPKAQTTHRHARTHSHPMAWRCVFRLVWNFFLVFVKFRSSVSSHCIFINFLYFDVFFAHCQNCGHRVQSTQPTAPEPERPSVSLCSFPSSSSSSWSELGHAWHLHVPPLATAALHRNLFHTYVGMHTSQRRLFLLLAFTFIAF